MIRRSSRRTNRRRTAPTTPSQNLGICRYRTRSHESAAPTHVTSARGGMAQKRRPSGSSCRAGLVLGPAGSRPALYAPLCLLFGRIPGNSAPGTTNLWNSSHNKLGGRKAHTSLSSADMHTVSCRFSLCAVELPASCAGAAVRAPASHGPTSPSSASPR